MNKEKISWNDLYQFIIDNELDLSDEPIKVRIEEEDRYRVIDLSISKIGGIKLEIG